MQEYVELRRLRRHLCKNSRTVEKTSPSEKYGHVH